MKKKFGAILMSGVMACSVMAGLAFTTACSGSQKPDFVMPEGGFDTENEVTIKFYHSMGQDNKKVLNASLEQFKLLYPNITVVEEAQGGYDDVRDQISKEIIPGNQPDIAYCYPDHVALFNQSGAVQSLNDFLPEGAYKDYTVKEVLLNDDGEQIKNEDGSIATQEVSLNLTQEQKDSYIDGYYKEGFMFDDGSKMYTLPFSKSTEVLYYNKNFFNAHPEIKVPTTWDEMEKACEQIHEIDPNVFPFTYDSEANWFITMCEQSGSDYTSSSGKNFLFDNTTNRAFVERFTGWYEKGYFTTQDLNGGKYTSDFFKNQKSYMCIGSSAGASNQLPSNTNGNYLFDVGITSIPQVKQSTDPDAANYDANYKAKVISQGPSVCIFKQDDPQRVLASWLLVKYLTTDVNFQAALSMRSGYVPVLKEEKMVENVAYKNHLALAVDDAKTSMANITAISAKVCMAQEDAYFVSPAFVGSSKARDQVGFLMQAAFTSKTSGKTIDQAFKDAISECEYYVG